MNYEQHMNTKSETTNLQHLSPSLAEGNHILLSPVTAMQTTQIKAVVLSFTPWLNRPINSCDELPPVHGYPSPRTRKVRGRVQSMDRHEASQICTHCAHDPPRKLKPFQ